jgi:hypothetical protein
MNDLTSRQRKLVFATGIIILLIPIIYLGAPASQDVNVTDTTVSGGVLAQKRHEYDLGETTLGDVDPSSAAMNLVLLGLRGPAAGLLHMKAIQYQEQKDWAKLRATVDSIIRLQPHYVQIWKFQGWNLAFNVSREWDRVADRFYWVKEGIKFMQRGTDRNATIAILFHDVGDFVSRKMGISDEKKFFRKFFIEDPDPAYEVNGAPGPDSDINPNAKDSYLVAKDWFTIANEKDEQYGMSGMTHVLFRQAPAKAQINFAEARQNDGNFDEQNRQAWEQGYNEWTNDYGNYIFLGLNDYKYKLNCSEDELIALAEENGIPVETQRDVWARNMNMVHYRFWRDFADCERDELTLDAHRTFYQAKLAYSEGRISDSVDAEGNTKISDAQRLLEESMMKWKAVREKYPSLMIDNDSYIEECMLVVYYWETVYKYNGKTPPDDYVLRDIWEANPGRRPDIQQQFLIETLRIGREF